MSGETINQQIVLFFVPQQTEEGVLKTLPNASLLPTYTQSVNVQ